jgi:hypothetical protein
LRAYQPKAGGTLSLFGQALLDGLCTRPNPVLDEAPIELRRKENTSTVEINNLGSYMKGRVAALIKASKESIVQIVRADVSSPDPASPIELAEIVSTPVIADADPMVDEVDSGVLDKSFGAPRITKDGVTVANEIELADKFENLGAIPNVPRDAWFRQRYSETTSPSAPLPARAKP